MAEDINYSEYYRRKMQKQFSKPACPEAPKSNSIQAPQKLKIQPLKPHQSIHIAREKRVNKAILLVLILLFIISFIGLVAFLPKSNISLIVIIGFGIILLFIILTLLHKLYEKSVMKTHPALLISIVYALLAINIILGIKLYSVEWAFLGFIVATVIIYDSKMDSRFLILPALLLLAYIPFLLIGKFNTLAENIAIYVYYFLVCGVVLQVIEHIKNITNTVSFDTFAKGALKELDWIKAVVVTGIISISIIIANRFYEWQLLKWTSVYLFTICLIVYLLSTIEEG
jgi:hypothetical protein